MIQILYKLLIFPIVILFFGDLLPLILLCDENVSEIITETNNEKSSKNTMQALMLFISASIILYFICNGFPGSAPGTDNLDVMSKLTETATTVPSQEFANSLQTKVTELGSENTYLRNILEERDTTIAQLKQQNDALHSSYRLSEMHNRDIRTFLKSLGVNDPKVDEITKQFFRNYGPHGRP